MIIKIENTVKSIDRAEWPQLCEPVWLCMLPIKASEMSKALKIEFKAEEETGVGSVWYCYISLKNKPVAFKAYSIDPADEHYVSVYIAGHETGWQQLLKDLCFLCSVNTNDLLHEETMLVENQWQLLSEDQAGNEQVILTFPDDFRAEQALAVYEKNNSGLGFKIRESSAVIET